MTPRHTKSVALRASASDFDGAIGDYDESDPAQPDEAATYEKRGYAWSKEAFDEGVVDLRQAVHAGGSPDHAGRVRNDCEDLDCRPTSPSFSATDEGASSVEVEVCQPLPRGREGSAGVALAYACKYAVSGVTADKAQTHFHLAKARS